LSTTRDRSQSPPTRRRTNRRHKKTNVSSSVAITARAPSFLYHQVRLMVGTLVAVGVGDMTPADVKALLDKKDVKQAPTMAPACGLYLARVHYDGSRKWDARRGGDTSVKAVSRRFANTN
jgi:tRNA pseudouridine(38-40) synthase